MYQKVCSADLRQRTALLASWGKNRCWELVIDQLQKMSEHGPQPDHVSYGAAVDACEKATQWTRTLSLLEELSHRRLNIESRTYASAASACGKARLWSLALHLMNTMWCIRMGCDERNFSVAISTCARAILWMRAWDLLDNMNQFVLVPGLVASTAAISTFEKSAQWTSAIVLFAGIADPDVVCISSIISACEKGTQWNKALALLHEAGLRRVRPNTVSYSAAVAACGKAGQWRFALCLVEEMRRQQLEIDNTYCVSVVSALERGAQWMLALQLLKHFGKNCLEPGLKGYSAAVSACEKGSLWEEALNLLGTMHRVHISPNVFTYNAALSGYAFAAQWRCALVLLSKACDVDIVGHAAALHAYVHCQQMRAMCILVMWVARHLQAHSAQLPSSSGSQRAAGELLLENNLVDAFNLPCAVHDRMLGKYLCSPVERRLSDLLANPTNVQAEVQACKLQMDVLDLGSRFSKDALNRLSLLNMKREDSSHACPHPSGTYVLDRSVCLPQRPLAKVLVVTLHCNLLVHQPLNQLNQGWELMWDASFRGAS